MRLPTILTLALPLLVIAGVSAALGQEQQSYYCKAPTKFAAGACVLECPAGYEDQGRVCTFQRQGGSGGR